MLHTFSNTLSGRAVIQSFEKLEEFRNEWVQARIFSLGQQELTNDFITVFTILLRKIQHRYSWENQRSSSVNSFLVLCKVSHIAWLRFKTIIWWTCCSCTLFFFAVIFLMFLCMIYLLITTSIYRFAIGIFAYLSFGYNLNKLLLVLFERDVTMDTLREANNFSKVMNHIYGYQMHLI